MTPVTLRGCAARRLGVLLMRRSATILVAFFAAPAVAAPPSPPFPDCAADNLGACPPELGENDWDMVGWIPEKSQATIRPAERALGAGLAADEAFRISLGRWQDAVAVIDSGIEWQDRGSAVKILLNAGELPFPTDASGADRGTWDFDANGVVDVRDWAEDPAVKVDAGRAPADDFLDPSDLIYTFSDGIDDDGNGYVDDIAGWDFFDFDNDPFSEPESELSNHGTGVLMGAVGAANDGGDLGSCPNCAALPLRVGDVFITDGDRVGLAIAYAVDRGARSVSMAVGSLSTSTLTHDAVAYADANGVILVGAAGDENGWHRNAPANEASILFVHSVRGDNQKEGDGGVFSYMNFFHCNNYGPRLDLVATSNACATGAVSKIAGSAALVYGAAAEVGVDLSADELRAVLRGTVDDVVLDEAEREAADTLPSGAGWDAYYGYGRADLGRAVGAVTRGQIPPVARLQSPDWFSWPSGDVTVTGRVAAPRGAVASWTLEVGTGLDPRTWTEIGAGVSSGEGVLGTVPASMAPAVTLRDLAGGDQYLARIERAHESAVTARLTVVDDAGRRSEDRRTFWMHEDPDALPGFPLRLPASGESPPILVDLDDDAVFEIVAGTGNGDVVVVDGTGAALPGWPQHTGPIPGLTGGWEKSPAFASGAVRVANEGIVAPVAAGDLDGDGRPEIVAASLRGGVYAWHADGTPVTGFPVRQLGRTPEERGPKRTWDQGSLAAPVLADIDGDGAAEVIVGGLDQRIYVWRGDGTALDGYPVEVCAPELCGAAGARIVASPGVADADGDGDLDLAFATNEIPVGGSGVLYWLDLSTATIRPGWPIEQDGLVNNREILPVIGTGHPGGPAIADLEGDGRMEVASNAMLGTDGMYDLDGVESLAPSYVLSAYGGSTNYPESSLTSVATSPAVGDLDGDGVPDLVVPGSSASFLVSLALSHVFDYAHGVAAWSGRTGEAMPGFPRQVDDVAFLTGPAIADVTGDGVPEVLMATAGGFVYAWDFQGNSARGFPKLTGGWTIGGLSVGDVDGDGYVDVVVSTRDGWLFAWKTLGRADRVSEWPSPRHDAANTGYLGTELPLQNGPPDERRGCCKKKDDPASAAIPLALVMLAWRRRRARR